jgi:hypothetical protein
MVENLEKMKTEQLEIKFTRQAIEHVDTTNAEKFEKEYSVYENK